MKLHTDHYFAIGAAHLSSGKPCQDHALSTFNAHYAGVVIADGCSSGGHTDVGARILTLATIEAIRDSARGTSIEAVAQQQKRLLAAARGLFNLQKSDMLATCAYAVASQAEGAVIHVQGDGAVAVKYRDGEIDIDHFEWNNNAPYYPAYSANEEERDFFAYHGARIAVANPTGNPPDLVEASQRFVRDGIDKQNPAFMAISELGRTSYGLTVETRVMKGDDRGEIKQEFTAEVGVSGHVIRLDPDVLERVELIAVFSDGVSQVENHDWEEVVTDFLAMKNLNGDFVKRRLIRGIQGMKARGKGPIDDISAAMICVEAE